MSWWVILVIVIIALIGLPALRWYYVKWRIKKSLWNFAKDMGMLAVTPEQVFEHNFDMLSQSRPQDAAALLWSRIMDDILGGKQPRKLDVERIKKLKWLKKVDREGRALFPATVYELDQTGRIRVFFHKDLTLAGYKDYGSEVETIVLKALEQKRLDSTGVEFLKKIHCLSESTKWGDHYGGIGFPYPDERYFVWAKAGGHQVELTFDENFDLLVAQYDDHDSDGHYLGKVMVWEKPGARKPELYKE